jgi:dihydrodipicolinate synthase/N-acetylneuraminate lyase
MKKNQIKNKIIGPIFSIITPFTKKEGIDYLNLEKYIKYMFFRGARCFFVMTYNSRLSLLDEKEIINLNLFVIKVVKSLDQNNIIICAEPYHTSTKKSIEYINIFHKHGADIVSVIFGEKFYSNDQVLSHFKKINDNTNSFLLLHQQPFENGISSKPPIINYNLDLLKKISKLKNFVAMKEDAKDKELTKNISSQLNKDIVIITSGGGKRQWLEASKYGCQSWLSGISNLDPLIAIDFYDLYKQNKKKRYMEIIKKIEDIFFEIKDVHGWHLTIKGMLELHGIYKRYERLPLKPANKNDLSKIKKVYIKLIKNSKNFFQSRYFCK